jgi:hypothetical protein
MKDTTLRDNVLLVLQVDGAQKRIAALEELLTKLEWAGNADCEGMMMGDPHPMHPNGHPACPLCGGLEPEQRFSNCFRDEALGHCDECDVRAALKAERPEEA